MNKVAVFGKPGSGKSTFSRALAGAMGIPFYPLDSIEYTYDGTPLEQGQLIERHEDLLGEDSWLIDGLGPIELFHRRLQAADTLIYINLPYAVCYWFVTKRLLKGLFVRPEGWPAGSSVLKGSMASYKILKLCPKFWNDEFLKTLETQYSSKSVYVIRSVAELNRFVKSKAL